LVRIKSIVYQLIVEITLNGPEKYSIFQKSKLPHFSEIPFNNNNNNNNKKK